MPLKGVHYFNVGSGYAPHIELPGSQQYVITLAAGGPASVILSDRDLNHSDPATETITTYSLPVTVPDTHHGTVRIGAGNGAYVRVDDDAVTVTDQVFVAGNFAVFWENGIGVRQKDGQRPVDGLSPKDARELAQALNSIADAVEEALG